MWILVIQSMLLEFILNLVYFPIWWYTGGVKHTVIWCWNLLQSGNLYLSPGLWLKNLFVPMYGQKDLQGRLMSIFMRFVNVIGRSFALLIWLIIVLILFLLWLIFPIFVIWMLSQSLSVS